jgi:hypothetical protein
MERGIGITPPDTLDESADDVVVLITIAVVHDGRPLDSCFRLGQTHNSLAGG